MFEDLARFAAWLPDEAPGGLSDLDPRLRIYRDDSIDIWYSPHGQGSLVARVWLLGITPGWCQVAIAYAGAARAVARGH